MNGKITEIGAFSGSLYIKWDNCEVGRYRPNDLKLRGNYISETRERIGTMMNGNPVFDRR
ncbi:MAG: hypothetical protein IIA19_00005 [Thaumarchaeota archaeon]|nr:hypothetical protein [Nitrososphaerota archaeon]